MVFEHDFDAFPELSNKQLETLKFISPHSQIEEDFEAEVVKVTDGDTVTLRTSFRDFDFPLRLLDIDAPELSEGGEASKAWLKNMIEGKKVSIMMNRDKRVGKYGRLLGQIIFGGINVGEIALSLGYAVPFGTKNQHLPQPIDKMFRVQQWF